LLVTPDSSVIPAWTAMILLRTITAGLTFRKVIPKRSQIEIPALVKNDWIHNRKYRAITLKMTRKTTIDDHSDADDDHRARIRVTLGE
jgi:hypothetical protein